MNFAIQGVHLRLELRLLWYTLMEECINWNFMDGML